jgi:hypothetical protein
MTAIGVGDKKSDLVADFQHAEFAERLHCRGNGLTAETKLCPQLCIPLFRLYLLFR